MIFAVLIVFALVLVSLFGLAPALGRNGSPKKSASRYRRASDDLELGLSHVRSEHLLPGRRYISLMSPRSARGRLPPPGRDGSIPPLTGRGPPDPGRVRFSPIVKVQEI